MLFGNWDCPLTNPKKGFCNWKNLSKCITEHEKSSQHCVNFVKWREMKKRLDKDKCILNQNESMIASETEKWRYLKSIWM